MIAMAGLAALRSGDPRPKQADSAEGDVETAVECTVMTNTGAHESAMIDTQQLCI